MDSFALVVFIIGVALIFDYINGFHDAANSIATVVSTQVPDAAGGRLLGRYLQFSRGLSAWGTGDRLDYRQSGFVNVRLVPPTGSFWPVCWGDSVGPFYLASGVADQFLPRVDRGLCRRCIRQ